MNIPDDAHLEPIPTGDDLSSLSAILMNEDYYHFTIEHSRLVEGIHLANFEALICLKAKAYIDMRMRKNLGEAVDQDDIDKHNKDIFRLAPMLTADSRYDLPKEMAKDMATYFEMVMDDLPNEDFLRNAGLRTMRIQGLLDALKRAFINAHP